MPYSYYVSYTINGTAFGFCEFVRDAPISTFADVMAMRSWIIDGLRGKVPNADQVVILNYQLLNAQAA